jgi:hypothetical protein
MIELFFTEEEGPDRDWNKNLYDDMLVEEDSLEMNTSSDTSALW